ncbi:MAG: acyl-CoA dehydrogenase family protein [Bdellovibrionota bacterium]
MIKDIDTLNILIDSIRRYVETELVPNEKLVEESDQIPQKIIQEMREMGLFGLSLPEKYGGSELTQEEEVLVAIELSKCSPAFRSVIGTNNGIGSQALVLDGTDAQREKYLPKLAAGEIIGAFCLTEPSSGSDAASLKTTATLDGDHYILNGSKRFVTNGPEADIFTVFARTSVEERKADGISAFIIEANTPGLSRSKSDKKMGQRGAHTCDVIFDNCRVPKTNLIGEREGIGFKTAMKVLDKGRLQIGAVSVGIAERMLKDTLKYSLEREQFGKPVAKFQLVQAMLADSQAEIIAAKSMILETARRRDNGEDITLEASSCKLFASEMCGRVADRCVQIHGGAGYMSEYDIERFYRDVRLFRLYEGTSQIQQLVIAREMIRRANATHS